ncbi:MAG: putative holliday junction resolvase [Bacteroidetes bacterium]|nr:MAG: putative holliday junction resolvase [Bacteroidota bacterium]
MRGITMALTEKIVNLPLNLRNLNMGRILAIDYGQKRSGIAVTDPSQLIANGLETVASKDLLSYIQSYMLKEQVDCIVVGEPKDMQNTASDASRFVDPFVRRLKALFPEQQIERYDERFTSKMAFQSMIDAGLSKKKRQNKALIDTISATIMLQSYMEFIKNKKFN